MTSNLPVLVLVLVPSMRFSSSFDGPVRARRPGEVVVVVVVVVGFGADVSPSASGPRTVSYWSHFYDFRV